MGPLLLCAVGFEVLIEHLAESLAQIYSRVFVQKDEITDKCDDVAAPHGIVFVLSHSSLTKRNRHQLDFVQAHLKKMEKPNVLFIHATSGTSISPFCVNDVPRAFDGTDGTNFRCAARYPWFDKSFPHLSKLLQTAANARKHSSAWLLKLHLPDSSWDNAFEFKELLKQICKRIPPAATGSGSGDAKSHSIVHLPTLSFKDNVANIMISDKIAKESTLQMSIVCSDSGRAIAAHLQHVFKGGYVQPHVDDTSSAAPKPTVPKTTTAAVSSSSAATSTTPAKHTLRLQVDLNAAKTRSSTVCILVLTEDALADSQVVAQVRDAIEQRRRVVVVYTRCGHLLLDAACSYCQKEAGGVYGGNTCRHWLHRTLHTHESEAGEWVHRFRAAAWAHGLPFRCPVVATSHDRPRAYEGMLTELICRCVQAPGEHPGGGGWHPGGGASRVQKRRKRKKKKSNKSAAVPVRMLSIW